jgi:hypothetical protein
MNDGVADARSRIQAEAWGRITDQHEGGGLCLLCGVRPGWVGATVVFLLPHTVGVLWAPLATPLSQLHCAGGHLHPTLRDIRGGAAVGAVVLVLLHVEGCELAPTTHRRLLLPAPNAGPCPLHCDYFPSQVGALERRLGVGTGGCPRPGHTSYRHPNH